MDSGLSFDASSAVYAGEDLALAVGGVKVSVCGGGTGRVLGEGVKRAGAQKEQDGGDYFPATIDSSIKQLHRTAFCSLKHTRNSYKPAIYKDSGLSFDIFRKCMGGRTWPLRLEGAGPGEEEGGISSIRGL